MACDGYSIWLSMRFFKFYLGGITTRQFILNQMKKFLLPQSTPIPPLPHAYVSWHI